MAEPKPNDVVRIARQVHVWDIDRGESTDVWKSRCGVLLEVRRDTKPYIAAYTGEGVCRKCQEHTVPGDGGIAY